MIKRKIIFSSSKPLNRGLSEEKEAYHENNIFEEDEENIDLGEEEYYPRLENIRQEEQNHPRTGDIIVDRMIELLRSSREGNLICIFNINCDKMIAYTKDYLSRNENCIILNTIDMECGNYDIYQQIVAQIGDYINERMRGELNSYAVRRFYNLAEKLFVSGKGDFYEDAFTKMQRININTKRPDILEEAINIFLNDLLEDRNRKIIVPICFYFKQIRIETLNWIHKITSNNIIFMIGTMCPYEFQIDTLRMNSYISMRNIFRD